MFLICSPKKVAYPRMSFLHLASEAFFQSPNRRSDVVFLHVRLLIEQTRQDGCFNVWISYILKEFWVWCQHLALCKDHILSIGVDQGEELWEVNEFLLQELETSEVLTVQEETLRIQQCDQDPIKISFAKKAWLLT